MKLIFYKQLTWNLVRVLGTLALVFLGYGLVSIIIMWLISHVASTLLCFYLFDKHIESFSFKIDIRVVFYLLRHSPAFLAITIVSMLSWRVDHVMLGWISGLTHVGLYAAAYKLFEATMTIPQAYMKSCFPQLSRLYRTDAGSYQRMGNTIVGHLCIYIFLLVAVVFPLAHLPVRILYGVGFQVSGTILRILVFGLIPWGIARVFSYFLVAAGKQKFDLVAGTAATALNIGLNYFFIRFWQGLGAAIATLSSLSLFCVLECFFVRRMVYKVPFHKIVVVPLILGLAVGVLVFAATINTVALVVVVGIALVATVIIVTRYSHILKSMFFVGEKIKSS